MLQELILPWLRWLFAVVAGTVIGLSMDGEQGIGWLFGSVVSLVFAAWLIIVHPRDFISNTLLAAGFYATAFRWLLGAYGGVMGGGWMALVLLFSVLQAATIYAWALAISNVNLRILVFPFALVAGEYARHVFAKAGDGNGLTMCLLGQIPAQIDLLIQIADIGGVWMLSFLFGVAAVGVVVWFIPNTPKRLSLGVGGASLVIWFVAIAYGTIQLNQYSAAKELASGSSQMELWLLDRKVRGEWSQMLQDRLAKTNLDASSRQVVALLPEIAFEWNATEPTSEQLRFLELAENPVLTIVTGVWLKDQRELSAAKNSLFILEHGEISTSVDKLCRVPFIEQRLWLTDWMLHAGLVPEHLIGSVGDSLPIDEAYWEQTDLVVRPSVCYDIYFSESFRRYPTAGYSINTCSLSELFDAWGGYQRLSHLHGKLRAVEFRRPLASCSLGGFSGVFDEVGREVEPQEVQDGLSVYHVRPTNHVTLYWHWGDWFPQLCVVVCFVGVVFDKWGVWSVAVTREKR